ncbi:MAG: cation:proton antiporter, partial [Kutzneria sp.]|nr:cation:proton antiporter [Kutzneria sp.]
MLDLAAALGVGAGVLLLSVFAVRLSVRLGLPSLLLYLGIGLLIGEAGAGIRFDDARLTQSLGIAALVLILTEGGLTTRWTAVRPAAGLGAALSTVGVVVSIVVTGGCLHLLLGLDWRTALLWGAVLSSTDAAAVFSVLRGIGVGGRLVGALELESGLNDAPAFLAVVLLGSTATLGWTTLPLVGYELAAGALVGAAIGWLGGATL